MMFHEFSDALQLIVAFGGTFAVHCAKGLIAVNEVHYIHIASLN